MMRFAHALSGTRFLSGLALVALSLFAGTAAFAGQSRSFHDFKPGQQPKSLSRAELKRDPSLLLRVQPGFLKNTQRLLRLVKGNRGLFRFLPNHLKQKPAFQKVALRHGVSVAYQLKRWFTPRSAPSYAAPPSMGASDTTNGYLTAKRPRYNYKKDDILTIVSSRKVKGIRWLLIKKAYKSTVTGAGLKKVYGRLNNVGGVAFKDFSLNRDAQWIPAAMFKRTFLANQYFTGIYTFLGVENGDTGINVKFQGVSFEGFDGRCGAILKAAQTKKLRKGDAVRLIWRKASHSHDKNRLIWVPFHWQPKR